MIPKLPPKSTAFRYTPLHRSFENFYAELEAWHAQVFEGTIKVEGYCTSASVTGGSINIQKGLFLPAPIVEPTAEDILKEMIVAWESKSTDWPPFIQKVRQWLAAKDKK